MRKCPSCGYANYNPAAVACEMCYAKLDKAEGGEAAKPAAKKDASKGDMEALVAAAAGDAPAKAATAAPSKAKAAGKADDGPEPPIDAVLFFLALPVTFPIAAYVGLRTKDWVAIPTLAWFGQAILFLSLAIGLSVALGPTRPAFIVGLIPVFLVASMAGAGLLVRLGETAAGWGALGTLGAGSCIALGAMALGMGGVQLEHPSAVSAISARRAGEATLVLTSCGDGVRLWSLERAEVVRQLEGQGRALTAVSLGATYAAAGGDDGAINLWTAKDGAIVRRLEGVKGGILAMALAETNDGPRVVAGGIDGEVRLLDGREGRRIRGPSNLKGVLTAVAWSADGKKLGAAGADKVAIVWDSETGLERRLGGHDATVQCVGFSPDGTKFATGAADGKVRIWDLTAQDEKAPPTIVPSLDQAGARALGFVDPKRLAVIYDSRAVSLWDATKGLPLGKVELPSQPTCMTVVGETLLIGVGRAVRKYEASQFH